MKMNRTRLVAIAIFGFICIANPMLRADDDDHHDMPPDHGNAEGGDHRFQPGDRGDAGAGGVSLEREMKAMAHAYRTIRSQVKDLTKNASTLAAVLDLEQHTLASKSVTPHVATTQPAAEKNAAKKAAYEVEMVKLLRRELDLEDALLANDNEKAIKAAADLHGLEEEGHKDFRPRDDD